MHVCGAFRKGKCMAYSRYHGTYASFPADLKHRSVKLGKRRHILKLSFFFRILRKPIARPAKTPNVTKFLIAKKSIRKSPASSEGFMAQKKGVYRDHEKVFVKGHKTALCVDGDCRIRD